MMFEVHNRSTRRRGGWCLDRVRLTFQMLSINRLGLRGTESERRVKVMTLNTLVIAPDHHDIRSGLQRPPFSLLDESPTDSAPPVTIPDNQANDLDSGTTV